MNKLPGSCLDGCLFVRKVACFSCAEWHGEIRQLSMKTTVNSGVAGLPAGCPEGCQ